MSRAQLAELGLGNEAIRHRLASGRLHRLLQGVYAVGRPEVGTRGRWMAAVLACGPQALLSHRSGATLWGIRPRSSAEIEIVVPAHVARGRPGIRVHRQIELSPAVRRVVDGIPVTDPVSTLVDLATCVPIGQLEAAVNEADHLDLVDPEALRAALDEHPRRPGVGRLRALLDAPTFALTGSPLERRFLKLVSTAGLPPPQTQVWLNGYRVDFHWPELRLVVEVDSLRYHRTASKQTTDKRRDQAHLSAGLTPLRFSGAQVQREPEYVRQVLRAVARNSAEGSGGR